MKDSAEIKSRKLSRRKKAKARRSLATVIGRVIADIDGDPFLRNHLFLSRSDDGKLTVGSYVIVHNEHRLFDVYNKQGNILHKNLYVFDAAMAITECLNSKRERFIPEILELEETYARNVNDVKLFRYMMGLKTEGKDIYEDRYVIVKQRAEKALQGIKKFRLVKS